MALAIPNGLESKMLCIKSLGKPTALEVEMGVQAEHLGSIVFPIYSGARFVSSARGDKWILVLDLAPRHVQVSKHGGL